MTTNVNWQSVKWPDGSTFEGLVNKDDLCHVRGVFKYSGGDRYEGEYQNNHMEGFGVYVWRDGTVYRGQWQKSMMHGCGVKISKQPNGNFLAEEGQFINDEWAGNMLACTVDQARAAAAESDIAAQMARVFELQDRTVSPVSKQSNGPAAVIGGFAETCRQSESDQSRTGAENVNRTQFKPLQFVSSLLGRQ